MKCLKIKSEAFNLPRCPPAPIMLGAQATPVRTSHVRHVVRKRLDSHHYSTSRVRHRRNSRRNFLVINRLRMLPNNAHGFLLHLIVASVFRNLRKERNTPTQRVWISPKLERKRNSVQRLCCAATSATKGTALEWNAGIHFSIMCPLLAQSLPAVTHGFNQ